MHSRCSMSCFAQNTYGKRLSLPCAVVSYSKPLPFHKKYSLFYFPLLKYHIFNEKINRNHYISRRRLVVVAGGGPRPYEYRICKECERRYRFKVSEKAWFEFNGLTLPKKCGKCREFRKLCREHGDADAEEYLLRAGTPTQFRVLRNVYLKEKHDARRQERRRNKEEVIMTERPRKKGKLQYMPDEDAREKLLARYKYAQAAKQKQLLQYGGYLLPPSLSSPSIPPITGPSSELVSLFQPVAALWEKKGKLVHPVPRPNLAGTPISVGAEGGVFVVTGRTPTRQVKLAKLRGMTVVAEKVLIEKERENESTDESSLADISLYNNKAVNETADKVKQNTSEKKKMTLLKEKRSRRDQKKTTSWRLLDRSEEVTAPGGERGKLEHDQESGEGRMKEGVANIAWTLDARAEKKERYRIADIERRRKIRTFKKPVSIVRNKQVKGRNFDIGSLKERREAEEREAESNQLPKLEKRDWRKLISLADEN